MSTWLKDIVFNNLLGKGKQNNDKSSVKFSPETVLEAIESVVDGTEPKIRYVPSYKKQLEKSVIKSLSYVDKLIDNIPAALDINRRNFAANPQVHAYFASFNEIEDIFSNSPELNLFFNDIDNIEQEQAYALLCMTREEKTIMGMELQNDILRREVMQTAVNFSEHKVMSPAASEKEIRDGLKKCIFDGLITNALQKLLGLKSQYRELQEQQCSLQSRLRSRQAQGGGLSNLLTSSYKVDSQCEVIIEKIAETENKIKNISPQWELPRYYIKQVKKILDHPEQFIRLETLSVKLNNMGIKISDNSNQDADLIPLDELTIANVLKRIIVIVRYPRNEMQPSENVF